MKKNLYLIILCIFLTSQVFGQMSQQARDSLNKLSAQDHQLMMNMLGISALRPGPSGNPQAPNAANSDESKASPYKSLPDPVVFKNGTKVRRAKDWEKRKLEIMEDFSREIYGRVPANTPAVVWEAVSQKDTVIGEYPVQVKQLL